MLNGRVLHRPLGELGGREDVAVSVSNHPGKVGSRCFPTSIFELR